jgi:hypothetical protein
MRLLRRNARIYASSWRSYTRLPGKNPRICVKHNQDKEKAKKLRLRMNRGCQVFRRQETQYKREHSKEKNTPNHEKKILSPVWSPILLRGKSLYG